jgi:hypothetical protein
MLRELSDFLADTALNHAFAQNESWVPVVQTIHILGIAVVLTTLVMLDCRILRGAAGRLPIAELTRCFMPWTWSALSALLVSGLLLVVAEPARELSSLPFRVKMVLVLILTGLTLSFERPQRANPEYWSASVGRRRAAKTLAAVSLMLTACIVAAGRLIAYVNHA